MPVHSALHGSIALLSLSMPGANALDFEFVEEFGQALDETNRGPAGAVVLTGSGAAFSAGLNLVKAAEFDRATMGRFVDAFDGMFRRAYAFPKPLVAAINGHAVAGGCILALTADWKVMARGPYRIGMTEVSLGIGFPSAAFEIGRQGTPEGMTTTEALLEGRSFSPEEALRIGLVHQLADKQDLLAAAMGKAEALATLPSAGVLAVKAELRRPVLERIDAYRIERRERFLATWFAPEARELIGRVREQLLSRRPTGKQQGTPPGQG